MPQACLGLDLANFEKPSMVGGEFPGRPVLINTMGHKLTSYLIFGGAGFIGRNVCEYIARNNAGSIHVYDNLSMGNQLVDAAFDFNLVVGDMKDHQKVKSLLETVRPEVIIHLVANSDILASSSNPQIDVENTLLSTVALSAALEEKPVPLLVFASSSAIFGSVSGPITNQTPARPESAYGYMKLASEILLESVANKGLINRLLIVRFPNVTGPWQTHGVVRDLVRKLMRNPDHLKVLGDGTQAKPYASADQLVGNIFKLIPNCPAGVTKALLAPNDQVTVKEIAESLVAQSGHRPKIEYGSDRSGWVGDVPEYAFDCSETDLLMGGMIFDSSKEAIRKSLEWELTNWSR
jgi:UDP-glucose 4-epimerase